MLRWVTVAVMLVGCSNKGVRQHHIEEEPDARQPEPAAFDRCESYNHFPPECYADGCGNARRECDYEWQCREWDDCDTGTCFQCRVLYFCECL